MNASDTSRPMRWTWTAIGAVLLVGATWIVRGQVQTRSSPMAINGMPEAGSEPSAGGGDDMAGMDMSSDGAISLTANQLRTFGVTFGTVEMRSLSQSVRAAGRVVADEARIEQVAPRVSGFVERLHVNVTGQPVRRGQPMLELYAPELLAAQQELLLAAELQRTLGRSVVPGVPSSNADLVAAARRRLTLWNISAAQIDEVLQTREIRRTLTVIAPASGIITERNVTQGQAVSAGQTLFTITDLSRVWVEVDLRGAEATAVRIGTLAEVTIAGVSDAMRTGRVEYVYATVDAESRTTRARIALTNSDGVLRPGMYATVRLATPVPSVLTVPSAAVVQTGTRALVFVDLGGGRLAPQEVIIGLVTGDFTEVIRGLEPGQRVVTSAQFLLDSESNLAEVMKSMIGMGGKMEDMPGMDMQGMDTKGMDTKGMDMSGTGKPAKTTPPPPR